LNKGTVKVAKKDGLLRIDFGGKDITNPSTINEAPDCRVYQHSDRQLQEHQVFEEIDLNEHYFRSKRKTSTTSREDL
jgi:hypothetical protein